MFKASKFILAAVTTAALAACGGGGGSPVAVSGTTANLVAAVNPTVASAVVNRPFVFSSGVPALGTTAATTVVFTNTATTPAFSISSGGNTATGVTTFGSCIFTITASTFPAGSPLALGQRTTIADCNLAVATSGAAANGGTSARATTLVFNTVSSTGQPLEVSVSPTGSVSINGVPTGTVTLGLITGS